jgi:hypothetical protein
MSWVVTVPGTISTPVPTIVQIGPSRMSMSCGRWSASVIDDAGYATSRKRVLPSEGTRRADLEVRNTRVAGKTDLLFDVTLRHPFIGAGLSGHTQGQLRNPDYPDQILESAAADKIRNYRDPYQRNRQVAFLPACMSTSGRIHDELLRLLFFLSNKQSDDYFEVLGYQDHKEEFCHLGGVFFHRNRCAIGMACAQAVSLRGAPTTARHHVPVPRGGSGGGRDAWRVSNLPPGHRVADGFRRADRDASA